MRDTKKGFTLLEVLTTLTIIGIMIGIFIPAVLQRTDNAHFKAAWKRSYSDLEAATGRLLNDNAGNLKGVFTSANDERDEYLKHMSFIKSCTSVGNATYGNCWHAMDGSS